jgi:AcrR family transcriptional regulator
VSDEAAQLRGQAARWAGQRERRRAEFVEAALGVIAEQGAEVSVEDIAARVGVARTRLYRHFTDRADLERAITARVAQSVVEHMDALWHPRGSARQMITGAIGAYVGWLDANRNLHRYLLSHAGVAEEGPGSYPAVRRTVAEHLAVLFGGYLGMLGVEPVVTTDLAHAVVGMVESVARSRLASDGHSVDEESATAAEVVARLADWTWTLVDSVLRRSGLTLDPDLELPQLIGLVAPTFGSGIQHGRQVSGDLGQHLADGPELRRTDSAQ